MGRRKNLAQRQSMRTIMYGEFKLAKYHLQLQVFGLIFLKQK